MLAAIAPCDQKMGDLTESLAQSKPGSGPAVTRAIADEADRICEAARTAFVTMRVPNSIDPNAQAMVKTAGQKWSAAMAARRRAVSLAREYLLKSDKATAEAYRKRLEAAQEQIGDGVQMLMAAGKSVGVDLMK
ncbi:MAG: hypothetical protein JWM77_179 [Rhodospirillales bacterium]|nr:hypothetical protein [Rhodospirillales bacterium]